MTQSVIAVIQARMSSTRLPGKVLMPVLGRPLLGYLLERVQRIRGLDGIVVATTTAAVDDPIVAVAQAAGVHVARGSEDDVLDRYYQAALARDAKHVMRLTADCPLLDPQICEEVLARYFSSGADYCHTSPRFAEGLDCEVFSMRLLREAWQRAKLKSEREHVTLYLHNHRSEYQLVQLDQARDDSTYRITVDEPADFDVVSAILTVLYPIFGAKLDSQAVLTFLAEHPAIHARNARIERNAGLRKSLENEGLVAPSKAKSMAFVEARARTRRKSR